MVEPCGRIIRDFLTEHVKIITALRLRSSRPIYWLKIRKNLLAGCYSTQAAMPGAAHLDVHAAGSLLAPQSSPSAASCWVLTARCSICVPTDSFCCWFVPTPNWWLTRAEQLSPRDLTTHQHGCPFLSVLCRPGSLFNLRMNVDEMKRSHARALRACLNWVCRIKFKS